MADREYVIKCLKYLHDRETWKEGPLVSDDHAEDRRRITADALALLREQDIGHWIFLTDCSNSGVYCSGCNTKVFDRYPFKMKLSYFCPHCGTRMEGEVERL